MGSKVTLADTLSVHILQAIHALGVEFLVEMATLMDDQQKQDPSLVAQKGTIEALIAATAIDEEYQQLLK